LLRTGLVSGPFWKAGNPDIPIVTHAYMWYSIAADQLSKEKNKAAKAMPPELLVEAEQRTAEWRKRTQGAGPASVDNPQRSRPTISSARASLA